MSAEGAFSIDQLMELAGLSVACAINDVYEPIAFKKILVCCGPGNNGGDGLVAARHLFHFGYEPHIFYPKRTSADIYVRLVKQCENLGIRVLNEISNLKDFHLILDGIFGFGFKSGLIKAPFDSTLSLIQQSSVPVVSIDIPSGWDVEEGDLSGSGLTPEMLISLTAPKLCAKKFTGKYHYLGGRFVPPSIQKLFGLNLPSYQSSEQFIKL